MNLTHCVIALAVSGWTAVTATAAPGPLELDLAGTWRFALDPEGAGESQQWFLRELPDRIPLPGTTDQAGKGYPLDRQTMTYAVPVLRTQWPGTRLPERADEAGTLVRDWFYVGRAWYQRDLDLPAAWQNRHVTLRLERVIWRTRVWLDERFVGTSDSLVTEHRFDLGAIPPGRHRLTICVDNDLQHNLGIIGHSYGPETQSRWNGLVGDLRLIATGSVFLRSIQVYPDVPGRKVRVRARIANPAAQRFDGTLAIDVHAGPGAAPIRVRPARRPIQTTATELIEDLEIELGPEARLWSEFSPALYELRADLRGRADEHRIAEQTTTRFGLREVRRNGRHLELNGQRIFLRGTLDCCVYPKTAHPPMHVKDWLRILRTVKDYGFNHVRFHSWCPPEAAFAAADRLGLYLEPETPFWVDGWTVGTGSRPKLFGFDPDTVDYVRREIRRLSDAYGNHPSFALFCIGNEFGMESDWEAVNQVLAEAKTHDPRRVYSASTARKRTPSDDFWLTHSTGRHGTRGVGPPHTDWDFSAAATEADLPVIAHETGQRPVFPDYAALLPKFTGPLKPLNYARLERHLAASGLAPQMEEFERGSARFQLVQYKAEHEGMRRTADFAGYQLLMLNDFTGQSEALVGILDPFWESKGVVRAEEVRRWNAPTVPLARFKRYTWTSDQSFEATLETAHFGARELHGVPVRWSLRDLVGPVRAAGVLGPCDIAAGQVTTLGSITASFGTVPKPTALLLRVTVGSAVNEWKHWVYPAPSADPPPANVLLTADLDAAARQTLAHGGRVLLLAAGLRNARTGRTAFESVYWSAGWWGNKFSSLGVLCDPAHPALAGFPNEGHSDWQWRALLQEGTVFDLTGAPAGYRPVVQSIPDFHYNRLLGLVFETRVGSGSLLVCGLNLAAAEPASRAFKASLLAYAASPAFAPSHTLDAGLLDRLLSAGLTGVMPRLGARIVRANSEATGFPAANLIDGKADTMWHTPWNDGAPQFPHEVIVAWTEPLEMQGVRLLPRQDNNANGWIKRFTLQTSLDGEHWDDPTGPGILAEDAELKEIRFERPIRARFLKLIALEPFAPDKPFASLAELEVIPAKP